MEQQTLNQETEQVEEEVDQAEQDQHQEPTEPETDEDHFQALFDERAAEDEEPEPEPEPETDEDEGEEPEPKTDDEPVEKPERPPETGAKGEPEWFQNLPEDVQGELTKHTNYTHHLYQSYTALMGRVPGLQRENGDLKKQVDSLTKQLAELQQAPTPTLEDLEKNDAFKEYAADFPTEAEELKKAFTSQARVAEQAKREAQQAQQAIQDQRKQLIQRETQRLSTQHPDWMQVRNSPMFEQWRQAILANPHQYPEMANKLSSMWAEDNIDVINQFKQDLAEVQGKGQQPHGQRTQSEKPKPTHRPKPPAPSPAPQGSGVSGNRRGNVQLSEEDEFDRLVRQGR